jgi:uncharacterized protein (TIGR02001 family)
MTAPAPVCRDTPVTPVRVRRRRGLARLGAGVAALALGVAAQAHAQVGFSAALTSDYRYRGFSLSDGRPAFTATVTYDQRAGGYLGLAGVGAATARDGVQALGYQAYAGYAAHLSADTSWDVGVTHSDLTEYITPRYRVRYSEVYAGIAAQHLSAHVYYSPDYLGEHVDTLYASLDGSLNRAADWRVFGHVGVLAPIRRGAGSEIHAAQYDLRAGVARRIKDWEAQVSVVGFGPGADYPPGHRQSRETLLVGVTRYF